MNKDYMLRMKPKIRGVSSPATAASPGGGGGYEAAAGWEVRPAGMFVQKRASDSNQRKNEKMDKASNDIAEVRSEVDKLAKQVACIELEINGGNQVVETVLLNLIELLMTQLIKLDGIAADGDVKLQRRMQVKRVQKYIEILDMLKIKNLGLGNMTLQKQS